MRYFYDTEFHEDGNTIDFISIGIVAEDGREYYAVSLDCDTERLVENDWLMENVMSSIDHETGPMIAFPGAPVKRWLMITDSAATTKAQIAQDIHDFIGDDKDPELWAWYGSYDHICLAQLWGKMIHMPKELPMYTNDIKTLAREAKRKLGIEPRFPKQPEGLHNALADARFNVVRYNYIREILDRAN